MTNDRESLPLSALQHLRFCPRQCALIHIEKQWAENWLTAEGRILHDKVHEAGEESRRELRVVRALRIQSMALGLHGVADIVEFHRQPDGTWQPFPVEYKRGRPKPEPIDSVQLCAQGICLEEMLGQIVPGGAIFYGKNHRRIDVPFSVELKAETRRLADELHSLIASGITPAAEYGPRCRSCSLLELCQPLAVKHSATQYLARLLNPND